MEYYKKVLMNYNVFTGRTKRSEYWYFILPNLVISLVLGFIHPWLSHIYALVMLVPSIAVGIRRMHDVDKSGWYLLIPIYDLVLACTEGTKGANQYGEEPK
jgi:uncharacterized membrane protein YhaH (DUF805 family)